LPLTVNGLISRTPNSELWKVFWPERLPEKNFRPLTTDQQSRTPHSRYLPGACRNSWASFRQKNFLLFFFNLWYL